MINRFDSARKFAFKIIESNELVPPIDPLQIIDSYGIEVIEKENQFGIEAYSRLDEDPKITINTELTFLPRRNFTLAHELGHIIIPWHNGDLKCNTDKPYNTISGQRLLDTQELEANIFASELLMPHNWIIQQIEDFSGTFQQTLNMIKDKAQTSVMACLYALEEALPSGNLYYVKKNNTNYWKKFSSQKTYAIGLHSNYEHRFRFIDQICEAKEHFNISQYEIIYYKLLPCPDSMTIEQIYGKNKDIVECVNIVSEYSPKKTILFLEYLLNELDDVYCCMIFENGTYWRNISHKNSKLYRCTPNYDSLIYTLDRNKLIYYITEEDQYKFVFIKEIITDIVEVRAVEPNSLLKSIVTDIYTNDYKSKLQSINGIVSNINTTYKNKDEKILYNAIKYRFAGDCRMIDFFNHPDFNTYVINKIRRMLHT